MQHLAIMKKSSGFLEKIVARKKTIESRWYFTKRAPWNNIFPNETVFFKNSGDFVTTKTKVKRVLQFDNLTHKQIKDILLKFGKELGIENGEEFFQIVKDKKYCILIFLDDVEQIKPFSINKTGFGMMSAWICVEDISLIKQ